MSEIQAVIQTGGKQYLVSKGDRIAIEKLEGENGKDITFDKVLMINGDKVQVGTPYVSGASVLGKILGQKKGKKVTIYKYKRRKGYHKKQGHRQNHTHVEITDIRI